MGCVPDPRQNSVTVRTANSILMREKTMITTASSRFGEPTSHKICVIYDPANGHIVHAHHVLTFPGAQEDADSEVEAKALALLARRTGKDVSGFGVLHVPSGEYQRGKRHRVELPSRRLIAEAPRTVSPRVGQR